MKLKGTKTEQDFRKLLISSNKDLMNNPKNKKLLEVLEDHYGFIQSAYVVNWIPEQDYEIFELLINNNLITRVERDRSETSSKLEIRRRELKEYRKGLSKINQIKLKVAEDLGKSKDN